MAEQANGFDREYDAQEYGAQQYEAGKPSQELSLAPAHPVSHLSQYDQRMEALHELVGEKLAQQFFWKAQTDTIQTFEHRLSYRHIHVDLETGEFFNQQRELISIERALFHALRYAEPLRKPMPLAPVVHEPNLAPFARLDEETGQLRLAKAIAGPPSPSVRGYFLWVFSGFRNKARAIASFAKGVSDSTRDKEKEALVPFETPELTLSAFTRRTA